MRCVCSPAIRYEQTRHLLGAYEARRTHCVLAHPACCPPPHPKYSSGGCFMHFGIFFFFLPPIGRDLFSSASANCLTYICNKKKDFTNLLCWGGKGGVGGMHGTARHNTGSSLFSSLGEEIKYTDRHGIKTVEGRGVLRSRYHG